MIKFNSKEEWKDYCFNNHKAYLKNKYFRGWLKQKRVDIFDYSELKQEEIRMIKKTIANALKICGKGFNVKLNKSTELNFNNGNIDGAKVLKWVKKSRKGKHSASIFLVNKKAKSGKDVLRFGDALTYVKDGVTIFTFNPSAKYPRRFFNEVIAHEIYHLLGFNIHHFDTKVKGYGKFSRCIMEYNAPSEHLCNKCRDGLLSFWRGLEHGKAM